MKLRIVLGNGSLASYQEGGGHWCVRLQYLLGLKALGHDVFLLELWWSTGDPGRDEERIRSFFERLRQYDLDDRAVLLLFEDKKALKQPIFELARVYGRSKRQVAEVITSADLLWNDCEGVRQPLLSMFRHRVLVDLDPGHLHVSALTVETDLHDHHAFLSVGSKLHHADCKVPTFGLTWHTFTPFVYLPMWNVAPDPGREAPFSSVTHWTYGGELPFEGRLVSTSKRDAYLRYADLPRRVGRSFELAAHIYPGLENRDRELLEGHGWNVVDPVTVAGSPASYQRYIANSRAELLCPKPVFRELKTGWFSDRSACYLASGRPVLAEDTGFSDVLPTGNGLLTFRDAAEALAGVAEIDRNYAHHSRAARQFAEEFLDSRKCLAAILSACG